jgi:hypothetical protein
MRHGHGERRALAPVGGEQRRATLARRGVLLQILAVLQLAVEQLVTVQARQTSGAALGVLGHPHRGILRV